MMSVAQFNKNEDKRKRKPACSLQSQLAMSPASIVEHLVLFKLRPSADPSETAAMISSLRSLSSLPSLPHLAVGPIRRHRPPAPDFTLLLHARFLSQPDLAAYSVDPSHLAVVRHNAPIIEDILAVDWAADLDPDHIVPPPGSAMKFLLVKAAEIAKAVDGVRGLKTSCGVNFSQGRAKGFEVGLILGFSRAEEMDGVEGEEEIKAIEEKIRDLVESVIVLDFVVPSVDL